MTPETLALSLALWVQGALTLVLLLILGRRRVPLVMRGDIRVRQIALESDAWPDSAKKASNAFDNQFQLPVLFFVAGAALIWQGPVWIEVVVVWLFMLSRIVHAVIHVTTNAVFPRFAAYCTGYALLIVLWGDLLVRWLAAALGGA